MIPFDLALIGLGAFLVHFLTRWAEAVEPFWKWFLNKRSILYWVTSAILSALSLLMREELMEMIGMVKPMTYAFLMCYGGGHLIAKVMDLRKASIEKKAQANVNS